MNESQQVHEIIRLNMSADHPDDLIFDEPEYRDTLAYQVMVLSVYVEEARRAIARSLPRFLRWLWGWDKRSTVSLFEEGEQDA